MEEEVIVDDGAINDLRADPDWVNLEQLNRLIALPVVPNDNVALPAVPNDNAIANPNITPNSTRQGASQAMIRGREYDWNEIKENTRLSILVMGIRVNATALRYRKRDCWRVKFDGRMGRSINLFENDEAFPDVKFL